MQSWNSQEQNNTPQDSLERRLSAYYGPRLREQPLPNEAWLQLRNQLTSRRPRSVDILLHIPLVVHGRRLLRKIFYHPQRFVPGYIEHAFEGVVDEARLSQQKTQALLRCTFQQGRDIRVRAARFIDLTLPIAAISSMPQQALQVLLATGLARYQLQQRVRYRLVSGLCALPALIGLSEGVLLWLKQLPVYSLLVVVGLVLASGLLSHWHQRSTAFLADTYAVVWLGRSATCEGLHMLADSSVHPARGRWGEPSLALRIKRVCGVQMATRDKHLTLAR